MNAKTYEITLDKFIYGGEVMGRLPAPDSRTVFVPYALPGERVRIELTFEKRGFARAKLLEVLEVSSERITPKCAHFPPLPEGEGLGVRATECVGCQYQHLSYESQLRVKEEIVKDQLTRIGKIENPPVNEIIPSPNIWHYRNQMDFQIGAGAASPNILEIEECHLPVPALNDFWQELEFGENNLFKQISLRQDAAENLMLIFRSENPETPEMTLEDELSVVHVVGDEMIVMGGDDHSVTMLHGRPFKVSATSFFQPNSAAAEKMIDHLLSDLPLNKETTLLELHSGVGSLSAFLAPKVKRLVCVEKSPTACDDFSVNLDEFENVELYQAQAMDVLKILDFTPDILLTDPPASGLGRHTLDGILRLAPLVLAYISRDPSTLARDAKKLIEGGYALTGVTPFDIAPQTFQIDSVAIFEL
jgi:23S rRNA (uracil1939-C5)-methyltransferase